MATWGTASTRRIAAAERREKAWALRRRGLSFRAIADELGRDPAVGERYSKSQAQRDVQFVLDELLARTVDNAAEARALDLARLDDLLAAWFESALRQGEATGSGRGATAAEATAAEALRDTLSQVDALGADDLEAVVKRATLSRQAADVVLKVLEQRGKMLGLYRQEVALATPMPVAVVVGAADLSGLGEAELDAIIRNLQAALGAGND